MVDHMLVCHGCGARYAFKPRFDPCDACKGPLDVESDIRAAFKRLDMRAIEASGGSIWKFAPFFPIAESENIVTLGEGGTPLLRHARLNALLGFPNLLIKNEAGNPTWSFKDRLNAINASLAREFGYRDLVAISTGNHGASAAAYASAAGMRSAVLMPNGTPDIYGQMVQACGGIAALTEWHGRSALLVHLVQQGWFPSKSALPTPISNPFGLQGYKSIAYEIAIEMRPRVPDYVLVPVGSGDAIYGIFKGFREFHELAIVDRIPVLVACEPAGANPVAKALQSQSVHVTKVAVSSTIAVSISEGIASDHALSAVRGSAGFAASPTDGEITDAMRLLASVGLVAESSSCVPLAAARRLVAEGKMAADATIVLILTSAGIKWPKQLSSIAPPAASIRPEPDALDDLLARKRP